MSDITKLRYIRSKDPDKLIEYTNKLIPYKIEIKGSPQFANRKWYLWFNLSDDVIKEMPHGDLD